MGILLDLWDFIDDVIRNGIQNVEVHFGFVLGLIVLMLITIFIIILGDEWNKNKDKPVNEICEKLGHDNHCNYCKRKRAEKK